MSRSRIQVLLVESDPKDAESCLEALRASGFDPTSERVGSRDSLMGCLQDPDREWDVVVGDHCWPDGEALEVLELVQEYAPDTTFIVLAESLEDDLALECLRRGAGDYVLKSNVGRLGPATERVLQARRDRAERFRLERELRQSQKMEAIGTLAAGVAHDLNNLLMAIFGFADIARNLSKDSDPVQQALNGIVEAANQANGVTRSLLTFSRRAAFEKSAVNLATVLGDASRLLRRMFSSAIEMETEVPDEARCWVKGDPVQLQQVVINLAVNSRDAMTAGGRLRLVLEPRPGFGEDDGAIALHVEDTGTGMSEEVLEHLFEPFFTTKPRSQGTGLGMAVVHGIVQDHEGRIQVWSEEGMGTHIQAVFPRIEAPPKELESESETGISLGHGERVLIAEDSLQVRSIIASSLEDRGYEAIQARDGEEALRLFAEHRDGIDLVVVDVDMPKVGGLSCLEEMRRARPGLPAIIISGLPDASMVGEHNDVGFLRKPFQMTDLTQLVHRVVSAARDPK